MEQPSGHIPAPGWSAWMWWHNGIGMPGRPAPRPIAVSRRVILMSLRVATSNERLKITFDSRHLAAALMLRPGDPFQFRLRNDDCRHGVRRDAVCAASARVTPATRWATVSH